MNLNNDERDLDTLLNLLNINNKDMPIQRIKYDINYIFKQFQLNLDKYDNNSYLEQMKNNIKNKCNNDIIIEMMLVNYKCFKYIPRKIQIISLLLILYNKELIEEVKTGEGKSTIIMFLAIIKALKGKKVDILTSSPVLAERDSKQNKQFYEYFGLTCDYCHEDEDNKNESLVYNCYNSNIVYGTILSFAGDYLRTSFIGTKGRGDRNFDVIIIDEIDNICLDNIMNQTQLLDNFKGYKFLEYIYLFIYYKLQKICINEFKNNHLILEKNKSIIVEKLLTEFNLFFDKNLNTNEIKFPPHLYEFIKNRKKDWCNCAYDALFTYKINKHYIIAYDEDLNFETIKPVDFSNTGVVEFKSVWTGLHQFLEIKHGLRLTEENLNTCFISNLCFFQLYNEKYGLTGTAGSIKTQEVLKDIYNFNVIYIPTFKESKYIFNSKSDFFCGNQEKFYENLLLDIYQKYNENRAILVIVKYIKNVNILYDKLKQSNKFNINDIITYTRNDNPGQNIFLNHEIGPKKIIISTNLCGRGTDIKITKECEANGGLHVILTFKTESERIEKQALGRAARKGEKGTGKIMFVGNCTYDNIKKNRDNNENVKFDYLMKTFKNNTIFFQKLFKKFCTELNKMKMKNNVDKRQIMDIKERWGLFLIENNLNKLEEQEDEKELKIKPKQNQAIIKIEIIKNTFDQIEEKFNDFIKEIFYSNKEYNYLNPFNIITDFKSESFVKAKEICDTLSIGADYMQIYDNIIRIKKKIDSKSLQEICNKFINLKEKVINLIKQYKLMKDLISNIKYSGDKKELHKQNCEKINYLESFKSNLENNIDFIKKIGVNKKYIYLNEFSIKSFYFKFEMEDIKRYFQDFGLFFLYTFQIEDPSCIIF